MGSKEFWSRMAAIVMAPLQAMGLMGVDIREVGFPVSPGWLLVYCIVLRFSKSVVQIYIMYFYN